MATAEVRPKCGDCGLFDSKAPDHNNKPIGTIFIDGKEVKKGLCRGPLGLLFQTLNEETECRQPEGIFKPIIQRENHAL